MKTKSLDTPTIDEILANICDQICSPDKLCEYCCEAKQALLQWVLDVIGDDDREHVGNRDLSSNYRNELRQEQRAKLKSIEESK